MKRYSIGITSELAVIGYNPEAADLDCPNGEIIREVCYLLAQDARGNRWRWGTFWNQAEAEQALAIDAPPVFLWDETYPEYGSLAYQQYGEADAIEAERRQAEDESWGFDTRFTRYH